MAHVQPEVHPTYLFNTVNRLPLNKNAKEKKHIIPLSWIELSWLKKINKSDTRHLTSPLYQWQRKIKLKEQLQK